MTPFRSIALAAMLAGASLAHAADNKARPSEVQGIRLSGICRDCGVVSSVRQETKKGKGSGAGAIGGAVAGGVVGNKTTDSTIGTIGGAAVGGLLGNEIEKRVKKEKVWVTRVTLKDGRSRKYESSSKPDDWRAGSVVVIEDGRLRRR
jgi:outer membrane lipoprotein SlyB